MTLRLSTLLTILLAAILLITGCAPSGASGMPALPKPSQTTTATLATPTIPPTAPQEATRKPEPTSIPAEPLLWVAPDVPAGMRDGLVLPVSIKLTEDRETANLFLTVADTENHITVTNWVYALAAPFPTTADSVASEDLLAGWRDGKALADWELPILLTAETKATLEAQLGPAKRGSVRVLDEETLLRTAWEENRLAIIPFETLEPRWKVLRIDSVSPFDRDMREYPLAVTFALTGTADNAESLTLPTNRDPEKLTRLVITGVTALSRRIAEKMESEGLIYPAKDIGGLLAEADLTHISNEVSFYADCPKPGPLRADMRFCSNPRYIKLLEAVGADIIELTGNHNLDWGFEPYLTSLEMYRERGWGVYGGGENLNAARVPLEAEHNGNRLVFIGCSPAGPEAVWATDLTPGSAPCKMEELEQQIRALRAEGMLPIVTFQHVETLGYVPSPAQGSPDFRRMARAGAVIVSGSQSHYAQTMTLVTGEHGASFVHYGLGNLFFDQMEPEEIRPAFIDRHIFYDGRYLGVELVTTILEEGARPRLMTTAERQKFLTTIFSLSDWDSE